MQIQRGGVRTHSDLQPWAKCGKFKVDNGLGEFALNVAIRYPTCAFMAQRRPPLNGLRGSTCSNRRRRHVIDGIKQPPQIRSTLRRSGMGDQGCCWPTRAFSGSLSVRRSSSEGCILSRAPPSPCLLRACSRCAADRLRQQDYLHGSIRCKSNETQRQQRAFALLAEPCFACPNPSYRVPSSRRQPLGGACEFNGVRGIGGKG